MHLELDQLLDELRERTKGKFARMPSVITKNNSFDVQKLPVDKPEWHAIDDVVCLYFDLKASTNLAKRRNPRSTASIYDAGIGALHK